MLTNPYNPLRIQQSENHSLHARVSQEDFYFLKQKFPYYPGLIDKLISNLFKKVIDELRERNSQTHIDTALYIDDPSYRILDEIVAGFTFVERRPVGEHSVGGPTSPQHESGGFDRVHPEMQRPTEQQPDEESSPSSGERSAEGTKKEKKQRRTSSRTVRKNEKGAQ